jgi:hypothetical protein
MLKTPPAAATESTGMMGFKTASNGVQECANMIGYIKTLSGLSIANEVQQIERRQRVADRDAEIVQGTGNLHHHIGDPLFG